MAAVRPLTRSIVCVECGYELRAHAHGADARCPECGRPVRDSRAAARVEWTPAIGIRRVLVHVLVYTPVAAAGLFGLLWVVRVPFAWFASSVAGFRYVLLLWLAGVPFAPVFVWLFGRQLQEKAGFTSWVLLPIALLAVGTSIGLGTWAAVNLAGVAGAPASAFAIGIGAVATGWTVHAMVMD